MMEVPVKNVRKFAVEPKMLVLWLGMVSMFMGFGAFTSAYIVRQADGNWLDFKLPSFFTVSSVIIVLSSITMHWAYLSAKRNNLGYLKTALGVTIVLGIGFLGAQLFAYNQMMNIGLYLVGNASSSFVYVISLMHGLHIIAGILVLFFTFVSALRYKIHSKSLLGIKLATTFWHFLGAVWIYLFIFLNLYH